MRTLHNFLKSISAILIIYLIISNTAVAQTDRSPLYEAFRGEPDRLLSSIRSGAISVNDLLPFTASDVKAFSMFKDAKLTPMCAAAYNIFASTPAISVNTIKQLIDLGGDVNSLCIYSGNLFNPLQFAYSLMPGKNRVESEATLFLKAKGAILPEQWIQFDELEKIADASFAQNEIEASKQARANLSILAGMALKIAGSVAKNSNLSLGSQNSTGIARDLISSAVNTSNGSTNHLSEESQKIIGSIINKDLPMPMTHSLKKYFSNLSEGAAWCAGTTQLERLILILKSKNAVLDGMNGCVCRPSEAKTPGNSYLCGIEYSPRVLLASAAINMDLPPAHQRIYTNPTDVLILQIRSGDAAKIEELKRLAINGDLDAQGSLARLYANGWGVMRDTTLAKNWARQAAALGNPEGEQVLGAISSLEASPIEAEKWTRLAAEKGHARAQFNLGQIYQFGLGVEEDNEEAIKWYRRAAAQGNSDAQWRIGYFYYAGIFSVRQDYSEAVRWYRMSAEHGNSNAQRNLGLAFENGEGVRLSLEEAMKWFRMAASQGDAISKVKIEKLAAQSAAIQSVRNSERAANPSPSPASSGSSGAVFMDALGKATINHTLGAITSAVSGGNRNAPLGQVTDIVLQSAFSGAGERKSDSVQATAQAGQPETNNRTNSLQRQSNVQTTASGDEVRNRQAALVCKASSTQNTGNPQVDTGCSLVAFNVCIYKSTGITNYNQQAKAQCQIFRDTWKNESVCSAPCADARTLPLN